MISSEQRRDNLYNQFIEECRQITVGQAKTQFIAEFLGKPVDEWLQIYSILEKFPTVLNDVKTIAHLYQENRELKKRYNELANKIKEGHDLLSRKN